MESGEGAASSASPYESSATPAPSSRARARWRLLRQAIARAGAQGADETAAGGGSASWATSAEALEPSPWFTRDEAGGKEHDVVAYHHIAAGPGSEDEVAVLRLPVSAGALPAAPSRSSALQRLVSHRVNDGVDNTGNVRVWPAEEALLAWCLSLGRRGPQAFAGKRVLELGAGMTGLLGLGLARCCAAPPAEVAITDGNPGCVANLEACVALNRPRLRCPVRVDRLVFGSGNSGGGDTGDAKGNKHQYDLILAADVLFFEAFHDGLIAELAARLGPTGQAWLLQPSRGGSLERFVAKARAQGQLEIIEEEEEEVGGTESVLSVPDTEPGERLRLLRVVVAMQGRRV